MQLLVGSGSFRVVQMGPDFLVVEEPFDHPPADASLILQIDGAERRWNVLLPNGISIDSKRVAIAASR